MATAAAAAAAAIAVAGCGDDGGGPPGDDGRTIVAEVRATPKQDLDLLFVIDDSPGLIEIQQSLAEGFPQLLARLQSAPEGLPNLHLGVVSTDMGTKTSGSPTPAPPIGQVGNGGCSGLGKGGALQTNLAALGADKFLVDVAQPGGTRQRNYSGSLETVLGQMVKGGAGGCGFEQPLAAMKAALGGLPANAGFLRPDAVLGVVLVADEDDCSAASTQLFAPESPAIGPLQSFRCTRFGVTCADGGATPDAMNQPGPKGRCGPSESAMMLDPIAPFRDFLRGLKSNPRDLAVAGLFGNPEPLAVELRQPPGGGNPISALAHSCTFQQTTGIAVADPGVRLRGFVEEFADRSTSASVCNRDLSGGLRQIGELMRRTLGSPCLEGELADADPATPGTDFDCIVEDVIGTTATKIQQCGASGPEPCWKLEVDLACHGPQNLRLDVMRSAPPPSETVTRVRCRLAR